MVLDEQAKKRIGDPLPEGFRLIYAESATTFEEHMLKLLEVKANAWDDTGSRIHPAPTDGNDSD